ncbi:MAG: hypothetical protein LC775_10275 [Acidobacteria bacterium]|nr:hypothetical protein [Acidobacteriota bacterium]
MSHFLRLQSSFLTLLFVCSCSCSVNPVAFRDQKSDKTKLEVARSNIPQVESAAFSGAASAWLVNYESGKLLHTNDGGLNWNQVPESAGGRISQISFIDADNGWAINKVGGRGGVWRTKDSGRTWVPIATIPSGDTQWDYTSAVQITFTDESHGWVIETFSIWRTEYGGVNWKQVFNTLDPRVKGQPVRGFFIDPLKGCALRGGRYITRRTVAERGTCRPWTRI